MARASAIPGLDASARFGDVAASAVEVRARELFEADDDVLDTGNIGHVHDMRVASRRLRTVLEVFAPCFPGREHAKLLREVKRLGSALGARRDPDVRIEALSRLAGRVPATERPELEALVTAAAREQERGNEQLAAALERAHERDLPGRLAALAAAARAEGDG